MNKEVLRWRRSQIAEIKKRKNLAEEDYRELRVLMQKVQTEIRGENLEVYPRDILLMLESMVTCQVFEREDLDELLAMFVKKLDEAIDKMGFDRWPKDENGIIDIPSIMA